MTEFVRTPDENFEHLARLPLRARDHDWQELRRHLPTHKHFVLQTPWPKSHAARSSGWHGRLVKLERERREAPAQFLSLAASDAP